MGRSALPRRHALATPVASGHYAMVTSFSQLSIARSVGVLGHLTAFGGTLSTFDRHNHCPVPPEHCTVLMLPHARSSRSALFGGSWCTSAPTVAFAPQRNANKFHFTAP